MKNLFSVILIVICSNLALSQKYSSKNAKIIFDASVPLFEDIHAENKNSTAIFNSDNGDVAVLALVKNFKFKVALMEEHFNENYVESAKFPKTFFKGKIINYNKENLQSSKSIIIIRGILNFHGVDKEMSVPAQVFMKDDKMVLKGKFIVKPADFKVKIPKMVTQKIAETVEVTFDFDLDKY